MALFMSEMHLLYISLCSLTFYYQVAKRERNPAQHSHGHLNTFQYNYRASFVTFQGELIQIV